MSKDPKMNLCLKHTILFELMAYEHQPNCKCWLLPDEVRTDPAIASRIPWLPKRPTSDIPFCRTAFYNNFIVNAPSTHEVILEKIAALRAWDVVFPFYLPRRYHTMDAVEIQKRCNKPGHYFFNATYFIKKHSEPLSALAFYNLKQGQLIYNIKAQILTSAFEGAKPDLCESAAEFLLEPWVLLQLSFQPALLHQWAVAALAETLRYCKQLVQIGSRGYAPQFHDVYMNLAKLSQTLARICNTLLSYFFNIHCKEPTETVHIKLFKTRIIWRLQAEALAILEFVLGDECTNIIEAIKATSWGKEFSPENLMASSDLSEVGLSDADLGRMGLLNIYSLSYWTHDHPHAELFLSKETAKKMKIDSTVKNINTDEKNMLQLAKEILSSFGESGDAEELLAGLKKNLDQETSESLLRETTEFCKWKETSSSSDYNINGFGAIINDLLSLQSDVLVEKALGKITRQVLLAANEFKKDKYEEAKVSPRVPLSIEDALDKITSVHKHHISWTPTGILEKIHATCQYDEELRLAPRMEMDNAAGLFAKLTRKTVVQHYKRQFLALQDLAPEGSPFVHYPDCIVLQYIFPCFVAMYLDLYRKSEANEPIKNYFFLFLMHLLIHFDKEAHTENLESSVKRFFYQTNIFQSSLSILYTEVREILKRAFGSGSVNFGWDDLAYDFFVVKIPPSRELKITVNDYSVKLYRMLCRIKHCLQVDVGIWEQETVRESLIVRQPLPVFITFKQQPSVIDKILLLKYIGGTPRGINVSFIENCGFVKSTNEISVAVKKDSLKLTMPQLFAISLYEAWNHQLGSESEFFSVYQGPLFAVDSNLDIANKIVKKDWWGIKKILAQYVKNEGEFEDISLIPVELAKNNLGCKPLLKALNASNKVKMEQPGQVTFFPIKHCRWCGAVHANRFRLCVKCKDTPQYPHPNYFCSKKCEKVALEKLHAEEHTRFITETMEKLEI